MPIRSFRNARAKSPEDFDSLELAHHSGRGGRGRTSRPTASSVARMRPRATRCSRAGTMAAVAWRLSAGTTAMFSARGGNVVLNQQNCPNQSPRRPIGDPARASRKALGRNRRASAVCQHVRLAATPAVGRKITCPTRSRRDRRPSEIIQKCPHSCDARNPSAYRKAVGRWDGIRRCYRPAVSVRRTGGLNVLPDDNGGPGKPSVICESTGGGGKVVGIAGSAYGSPAIGPNLNSGIQQGKSDISVPTSCPSLTMEISLSVGGGGSAGGGGSLSVGQG